MANTLKYKHDPALKDAWIDGMIEAIFLLNSKLNKYDIKTVVLDLNVTISGQVNNTIDYWHCIELLKGIKAIKKLNNHLTVVDLEKLPSSSESFNIREAFWHWQNDTNITAEVKSKLEWNKTLSGNEIIVNTTKAVVTLSGIVEYKANKALAELITSQINEVQEIKNKITFNT